MSIAKLPLSFRSPNPILIYIPFWFVMNLFFLQSFPFFHTDEAWLSGLSRGMMEEERLDATEPFFDLYSRHPHGIKLIYHGLEILSFTLFGYSLFSARILSLFAGGVSLYFFHEILCKLMPTDSKGKGYYPAFIVTLAFSWDIQFLYASHTARQEIFLLSTLLLTLSLFLTKSLCLRGRNNFLIGLIAGLGFGIHPNAFLTTVPLILLYSLELIRKRIRPVDYFFFLLGISAGVFPFLLFSFVFNHHFIGDYLAFGKTVGVTDGLDLKILRWPLFHEKLYTRIGGTYYLPDIRYFYLSIPLIFLPLFLLKGEAPIGIPITCMVGISLGTLLLGKYSPPSLIFLFPFPYMGFFLLLLKGKRALTLSSLTLLLLIPLAISLTQLREEIRRENGLFGDYIEEISRFIPRESSVLGGLSLEYYLDRGDLYDWRNLAYLEENGLTLEEYLSERNIEYILFPSELSYIYENRPVWNSLYGNPSYWYPQLSEILQKKGVLLEEFASPGYGTRIAAYRHHIGEYTRIYRLEEYSSRRE